jgi:hypothetical protein
VLRDIVDDVEKKAGVLYFVTVVNGVSYRYS